MTQQKESNGVQTRTPARPANLDSDVLVPLAQAAITALLLATIAWALVDGLSDKDPLPAAGATFLISLFVVWLLLLVDTRSLLRIVEWVVGEDLDGDDHVGTPTAKPQLVFMNAKRSRAEIEQRQEEVELAEAKRLLVSFLRRIPVKGTAWDTWEPELGRDLYLEFRDGLMEMGWADWKKYNAKGKPITGKGWALTLEPEEIIDRLD